VVAALHVGVIAGVRNLRIIQPPVVPAVAEASEVVFFRLPEPPAPASAPEAAPEPVQAPEIVPLPEPKDNAESVSETISMISQDLISNLLPETLVPQIAIPREMTPHVDADFHTFGLASASETSGSGPMTNRDVWASYSPLIPSMILPEITNRAEMKRFLDRRYAPLARRGVRGTVMVRFWIDEEGEVRKAEVNTSSGIRQLDELSLELAPLLRFSPASQAGSRVRVVVELPVKFEAL
jgi:TonB family protein